MAMNSYLGQKGYTVLKSDLTPQQLQKITADLTARPMSGTTASGGGGGSMSGARGGGGGGGGGLPFGMKASRQFAQSYADEEYMYGSRGSTQEVCFPVYRETAKKLYLPRFYGETMFGPPRAMKLGEGEDIALTFAGELRPNQVPVVDTYLAAVSATEPFGGGGLLELECAYGKTVLSLFLIAALRKKTLVIVHKEFLMNQWIERIQQFLPCARVGKLQGTVAEIENNDIVIGMLQTLSMKEIPAETFASFGFTIIDEVHHISSEVFSCALFRIVTKYMLGLSATMERKDGMTKIFKMFLGEVLFKGKRDDVHKVEVRGLTYMVKDDPEFNRVLVDARGNVKFSTMISKLCSYQPRSDFILRVLADMLLASRGASPPMQVMILAHNKSLLKYLHDSVTSRHMATVGYYIGGMKEADLKKSETCQVIIATYSMAAEALDIKTLNTLIMATPKTDIEQSVGRILRDVKSTPVILDIVDEHPPFQNQWKKRKAYYKMQKYTIKETSSLMYTSDMGLWQTTFASKSGEEEIAREVQKAIAGSSNGCGATGIRLLEPSSSPSPSASLSPSQPLALSLSLSLSSSRDLTEAENKEKMRRLFVDRKYGTR